MVPDSLLEMPDDLVGGDFDSESINHDAPLSSLWSSARACLRRAQNKAVAQVATLQQVACVRGRPPHAARRSFCNAGNRPARRTCYGVSVEMVFAVRLLVVSALSIIASTATAAAQAEPASCDVPAQNLFVRDVMSDIYLWYQEIPDVDPVGFDSPAAYLEAIRYRPLDDTFSYVTSRAASEAFFSESQFVGFGFSSTFIAPGELRVTDVMPGSPASEANLSRGDRIVEIDGRSVEVLHDAGELDGAFGPSEPGRQAELVVVRANSPFRARMEKRVVTIPTVSRTQVYSPEGRQVGYLFFRNFVTPSYEALDGAFSDFQARGVRDVVLDLRYNGGGLVGVAQHLASLIGGARTEGQVFAEYFHNDRNASRNRVTRFEQKSHALGLERLIVITTRASASASELVINALKPFIPVFVIGSPTYGKPVGQYQIEFCDKTLAPVSFALRNANGEGDFFGGIPPTCAAPDDLDHQIGDSRESSLREALTVVSTGRCSGPQTASAQRRVNEPAVMLPNGWQSLLNAH
jgi:carboxyl-terminal processing protease